MVETWWWVNAWMLKGGVGKGDVSISWLKIWTFVAAAILTNKVHNQWLFCNFAAFKDYYCSYLLQVQIWKWLLIFTERKASSLDAQLHLEKILVQFLRFLLLIGSVIRGEMLGVKNSVSFYQTVKDSISVCLTRRSEELILSELIL
jgi:hypothetical protein